MAIFDKFVDAVRSSINRVYIEAMTDFAVENLFCFVDPRAKVSVSPLFIEFPLSTGFDRRGRKVLVADAKQERFRQEIDERVGPLFAQYVDRTGQDPTIVSERLVEWSSRPFGVRIPNPQKPRTLFWSERFLRELPDEVKLDSGRRIVFPLVPMGVRYDAGKARLFCLDRSKDSHVLIAGATGSGKSELIRACLLSIIAATDPRDVEILRIDKKRRSLEDFDAAPHCRQPVAHTQADSVAMVHALVREMRRRISEGVDQPSIFLFVDELADLIDGDSQVEAWIEDIASMGRELNIFLVCGTQKPLYKNVGQAKGQFTIKFIGRMASSSDADAVAQTKTNAGQFWHAGSFAVVTGAGRSVDIRAALATKEKILDVIARSSNRYPEELTSCLEVHVSEVSTGRAIAKEVDEIEQAREDLEKLVAEFGDDLSKTSQRKKLLFLGLSDKGATFYADKERLGRALALLEEEVVAA